MSARLRFFLATLVAIGLLSSSAWSAPRDKAALKKIQEAIYTHFLNTDFDKAEGILIGTIRACEDQCSPSVKAKAWMYVGVVRGSGRNDLEGATQAFNEALLLDPNASLDSELASPPVREAWQAAVAAAGAAPAGGGPVQTGGGEASEFTCTLEISEVQSRRQVPIACGTPAAAASAKLYFKGFAQSWDSVAMREVDGEWQGTVPCDATEMTGTLRWYVEGYDSGGSVVAAGGSEDEPNTVEIVAETSEAAPSFPGQSPPPRCSEPGLGGGGGGGQCGGWGESCGADDCCNAGLVCILGTCEAEQCESDADCDGGSCVDGKCEGEGEEGGGGPKNWISLQFGMDITSVSTNQACTDAGRNDEHFNCFLGDQTYFGPVNKNAAGSIGGGLAPATMRLLASYERTFGSFGAEVRLGFAFNGGRKPEGGSAFFPVHAEVRGKYWFSDSGLRPWVHLGGGLAQIDTKIDTDVGDCSEANTAVTDSNRDQCINSDANDPLVDVKKVQTVKVLGNAFVTFGGGFMYAIGPNHGPLLNLNLMVTFPNVGFVLEPSLGYAFGF